MITTSQQVHSLDKYKVHDGDSPEIKELALPLEGCEASLQPPDHSRFSFDPNNSHFTNCSAPKRNALRLRPIICVE